jgi:hypothetical protein
VIAIPIVDRLKPNIPGGKTLGNLKPFSAKWNLGISAGQDMIRKIKFWIYSREYRYDTALEAPSEYE